MLPLAQHKPVGLAHPFVTPWAKAQATPTAELYKSPPVVRPWQLKLPPLTGELLQSSNSARQKANQRKAAVRAAKATVRALEKKLAEDTLEKNLEGDGLDADEVKALRAELDAARRASTPAPMPPRALRRESWRTARKEVRANVFTMNQTEGSTYPAAFATRAWRGLWRKAVAR
jgi:hypothetical protein